MKKYTLAWAVVSRQDGRILRDGRGHYGIYTHKWDAVEDCPKYGQVARVRIAAVTSIVPIANNRSENDNRGSVK